MVQPHVAPLALSDIEDPELLRLLDQCETLGVPDQVLVRIIARVPDMAKRTLRMLLQSYVEGNVDHKLKEIIRIQLARFVGDPYFAALRSKKAQAAGLTEAEIDAGSGDYDDSAHFTEGQKCALRYAEQMFLDASKVDKAFYDELRTHYTEPQIMELGSFIAFHYGIIKLSRALGVVPMRQSA